MSAVVVRRLLRQRALAAAIATHGPEHPAARAAQGRLWVYLGRTPQRGATTPEAVAWARESGLRPVWNRAQRHHAAAIINRFFTDVPTYAALAQTAQ